MKRALLAALICFPAAASDAPEGGPWEKYQKAAPGVGLSGLLVVGKFTGLCGALDEMVRLQAELKMPGGDEFVSRFWAVTAAKQGLTVEALSTQCDDVFGMYGVVFEAAIAVDAEDLAQ